MSYLAGSQLAPGTTVAGYLIETLIGRGGMGAVYRAVDERLGRKVALKVIAPELAQDERFRERFLRESRIAVSLDHPHIVPIFNAGEEDGVLFLAMRYVEGSDLAKMVAEDGVVEPRRAVDLLSQVAGALDAAHEKGLVHRDVKPSNVLVTGAAGKEHCYLADFGLTKRTGSLSGVSAAGDIVGTLEYVAPEQITGEPLDERADVYSLGCVLYECLTGQSPFPRATDVALLWAHVNEEPPRPSELRPQLPRELDAVLTRGLAKEPARRYATAGEFVAAARTALGLAQGAPAERQPRLVTAGIAALAVVVVIAALSAVLLRSDSGRLSEVAVNSVGIVDSRSEEIRGEIAVGAKPEGLAVGDGALWVAVFDDGAILQIDLESGQRLRTLRVGEYASDVAVGGAAVWVTSAEVDNSIRPQAPNFLSFQNAETFAPVVGSIDPDTASIEITPLGEGLRCRSPSVSVAVTRTAAWYACDAHLGRINLRTRAAQRVSYEAIALTTGGRSTAQASFSDIAFGLGSLWLANRATNSITRIDPHAGRAIREITVGRPPTAVAVGAGSVWVASYDDDSVTRIDVRARGGPVTERIPVGDGPVDVVASDEDVWVANELAGTLSRIDPEGNEVVGTVDMGNPPRRLALGDGLLWVTVQGDEAAVQP